ncbi:BON domain-containing protein [Micromonospora zamorensis]|uniref:BON domain-containing protein n=1 Tax=Micromonospora zamorensis TaxID=709883 RepID=UPI003D8CE623
MTQTTHKTDHELKAAVADELEWAPSVNSDRIAISVDSGAITLSGQVETYPEKEAATRAVLHVRGVTAVADEITVKNTWAPREDSDIAREASEALDRMVYVPAGAVQAKVHHHVITLTGSLTWEYQRQAARDAMAVLRGVRGVVNMISLKPTAAMSPIEAKAKITAALIRNARFDGQHITVHVDGTEIELSGTLSSWAEVRQASYAAWASPGVTRVENRILVRY